MKAILMSIQPKWCELIAEGEKTIEVRKTKPKLDVPFKVYMYCTKPNTGSTEDRFYNYLPPHDTPKQENGTIIGEFVCDKLVWVISHPDVFAGHPCFYAQAIKDACMTEDEAETYSGGADVYGFHISDLVIYDKPKGLRKFVIPTKNGCASEGKCRNCRWFCRGNGYNVEDDCKAPFSTDDYKPLTRPPQSWCYVEEILI